MENFLKKYLELSDDKKGPFNFTALQLLSKISISLKPIEDYLKNKSAEYINLADDFGRTALYHAAYNGNVELMEMLLNHGADMNAMPIRELNEIPKNFECDQKWIPFLPTYEDDKQMLSQSVNVLFVVAYKGYTNAVQFLLDKKILNLEITENNSNSKIQIESDILSLTQFAAISRGHEDCFKLLIKYGLDLSYEVKNVSMVDAIYANVVNPVEFFINIFDVKIYEERRKESDNEREIKIDFSILAPQGKLQMHVFNEMTERDDEDDYIELLQHPVLKTYLKLKWAKIRNFFLFQIAIYLVFVLSLSGYVLLLLRKNKSETTIMVAKCFLIITSSETFIHTFIRFALLSRKSRNQMEVVMNLICTSLAFVITFIDEIDPNVYYSDTPNWVLHATSVAVLLAWGELMLLIGRLPKYGQYALMFTSVFEKVIKVLMTFSCLIFGFAISFSIQFDMYQFNHVWISIVKTTVMMMGEYEYSQLFNDVKDNEPNFRLHATSRVIFLLFIVLVSIVLMNLMIGLAVDDIQELQKLGQVRRHLKQAEFLNNVENVFKLLKRFEYFKRKIEKFVNIPNQVTISVQRNYNLEKKYINYLLQYSANRKKGEDKIEKILRIIKQELRKL